VTLVRDQKVPLYNGMTIFVNLIK